MILCSVLCLLLFYHHFLLNPIVLFHTIRVRGHKHNINFKFSLKTFLLFVVSTRELEYLENCFNASCNLNIERQSSSLFLLDTLMRIAQGPKWFSFIFFSNISMYKQNPSKCFMFFQGTFLQKSS